jgi:hypothetical protein
VATTDAGNRKGFLAHNRLSPYESFDERPTTKDE